MLSTTLLLSTLVMGGPVPADVAQKDKEAVVRPQVEAVCLDGSKLKVTLLDDSIPVTTKYGELKVPLSAVKGIEFASRCSPAMEEDIAKCVSNLGHPDFQTREDASRRLKEIGPRAYPAAVKATKSADPEVARRAEEIATYLKNRHNVTLRPDDVVYADDSKLVGKINIEYLKVKTVMFGEQSLRLWDLDKIGTAASVDQNAPAAPANLNSPEYQNKFDKEYTFKVTGGRVDPNNPGSVGVWGSGPYTLDSKIELAAVHAGVVQPGETKVVRIRVVSPPPTFDAGNQNGVPTAAYGAYPAGAYIFVR